MWRQLDARGAREHAHATLRQAVGGIAGHGPVLMHGRDVDDPPALALLDHLLGGELRAEERALQVDLEDLVVLLLGGVEHGGAGLHAGVVHHDVEPTEPRHGRVDELVQIGDLAHVRLAADGLRSQPGDLLAQFLRGIRIEKVVDDHFRALGREGQHDGLPDAAVASGDDGDLVLKGHDHASDCDEERFRGWIHGDATAASVPAPGGIVRGCRGFGGEVVDEVGDEAGPAGLVRGAETVAVVAVEVFVERDVVPEVRVVLELGVAAEDRPAAVRAAQEERTSAVARAHRRSRRGSTSRPSRSGTRS